MADIILIYTILYLIPMRRTGEKEGGGVIHFDLSNKEFRRLLDLVYIGNWVLNSTRGEDRIPDYDEVESAVFAQCLQESGMEELYAIDGGTVLPSTAFEEGGIHEAIMDYEDSVFFDILAEELARRDMDFAPVTEANYRELTERMEEYLEEFDENGVDNLVLDK